MRGIRIVVMFLFIQAVSFSQQDSALIKNAKGKTLRQLGKNAMRQNDPNTAIYYLEPYTKNYKKDAVAKFLLAESYLKVRDYERAERMFLNAYNTDKKKVPEALYFHALMQKSNGKYDSAKVNFQKFKKEYKGSEKALKRQASKEIGFCDSISKIAAIKSKIVIQRLDTSINKVNVEAAALSIDENSMLYTSLRTEQREYISEEGEEKPKTRKLYLANRKNNQWKFAGEFGEQFNDEDFNTGNACFSQDKNRIYFTRCKLNNQNEMICAIYVSEKLGSAWSSPVKLPKVVNNPKYTATMPAVTSDPVKGNDVIYFVSDRKGKGKLDIWYTIYDKKNKVYKEPRNAGVKINSSQNEMSPFFDNETRTLYYSSDGFGGLGGFDVFKAQGNGKKWESPVNVGPPINSGADDLYYTLSPNRHEGFFVSNRKGGNALKNSTCCDDIYTFKNKDYILINLKGNISESLNDQIDIQDAVIEIYLKNKDSDEKFLIKTTRSDKQGNYQAKLEAGQQYYLIVKKEGYLGSSGEVSTKEIISSKDIVEDLQMVKIPKTPIHIPNINYEYDRSKLMPQSKIVLDTTILRLMNNNPELIVEIQSHTDSKGSDQYNMKLSQRRAEEVVNYLSIKGIDIKRLKAKGYGESAPVAPNENPDGTDNPEGRAKNRRAAFKIIGVIDSELINDSVIE